MFRWTKKSSLVFSISTLWKIVVSFSVLAFALFLLEVTVLFDTSDMGAVDVLKVNVQNVQMYNECFAWLYHHYPTSSVFTNLMPASITAFDHQQCSTLLNSNAPRRSVKGEWIQCLPEKAFAAGQMKTATLANTTEQWTLRHQKTKHYEPRAWLNVYHGGISPAQLVVQGNAVLGALGLTKLIMRIESEMAACRSWRTEEIAAACSRPDPTVFGGNDSDNVVLVELGSANGNLLHSFCPPDPLRRIRCYGVELIPALVDDALSYQRHMYFEKGIKSSLRDSSATHVLIHGVLTIISLRDGCDSICEGIRLLVPGGILLIVMLHTGLQSVWPTRHHPFFFKSHGKLNSTTRFASSTLPFCSMHCQVNFDELVDSVEFLWNAREFLFYNPDYERTGIYAVRLTRSAKKMPNKEEGKTRNETPETLEKDLYKKMCANPGELSSMRSAQKMWSDMVVDMNAHYIMRRVKKGVYIWVQRGKR